MYNFLILDFKCLFLVKREGSVSVQFHELLKYDISGRGFVIFDAV